MTDTPTTRLKLRQQSQGSNTNTWGDDKLNEVLRVIDRSVKGVQTLTITGSTTLSFTNYVATNDGEVSVLIVTGSLSAAATLTVPSSEWQWDLIKNTTGQTLNINTASGVAISLPNNRQAPVYCDGSNCSFGGTNYVGTGYTLANSGDVANKIYVDTAVATLGSGSIGVGTVLIDGADTTAGFLNSKTDTAGTGELSTSIETPGGNSKLLFTFTRDEGQIALYDSVMAL